MKLGDMVKVTGKVVEIAETESGIKIAIKFEKADLWHSKIILPLEEVEK